MRLVTSTFRGPYRKGARIVDTCIREGSGRLNADCR